MYELKERSKEQKEADEKLNRELNGQIEVLNSDIKEMRDKLD